MACFKKYLLFSPLAILLYGAPASALSDIYGENNTQPYTQQYSQPHVKPKLSWDVKEPDNLDNCMDINKPKCNELWFKQEKDNERALRDFERDMRRYNKGH